MKMVLKSKVFNNDIEWMIQVFLHFNTGGDWGDPPPPPHTIVKGYINAWFSVQWTAVSHFG